MRIACPFVLIGEFMPFTSRVLRVIGGTTWINDTKNEGAKILFRQGCLRRILLAIAHVKRRHEIEYLYTLPCCRLFQRHVVQSNCASGGGMYSPLCKKKPLDELYARKERKETEETEIRL